MKIHQQNSDQSLEQDQAELLRFSETQQPKEEKSKLCWFAEFLIEVSVNVVAEFFSHH